MSIFVRDFEIDGGQLHPLLPLNTNLI